MYVLDWLVSLVKSADLQKNYKHLWYLEPITALRGITRFHSIIPGRLSPSALHFRYGSSVCPCPTVSAARSLPGRAIVSPVDKIFAARLRRRPRSLNYCRVLYFAGIVVKVSSVQLCTYPIILLIWHLHVQLTYHWKMISYSMWMAFQNSYSIHFGNSTYVYGVYSVFYKSVWLINDTVKQN